MDGLKAMTRELLRCGAPIQEINTVRKHLSAIQGGRLAAACRAPVLALVISDVTGDDPTHIASGPCAPDPTTVADAQAVLQKYGIPAPGPFSETPKPGDPLFSRVENRVIATARRSLEAAAEVFRAAGITPVILGDDITGEASEVGKDMATQVRHSNRRSVLISGGECTVTVRGSGGRGGRCSEFLLALAIELQGAAGIHAIAADTDGIDGSEDNAGAWIAPDTLARAAAKGIDAGEMLAGNDSYGFFFALGDLLVTGPTRTNVNDYRAILID
jgi:hydroxypyruvate reductase